MSKEFKLLIYEDTESWTKAFEFNVRKRLKAIGIILKLMPRIDDSTFESDLEFVPDLIMVDFDLGKLTGKDIIERIEADPDFRSTSICLYSGGESIESMQKISSNFKGNVICHTKEGDDLVGFIINRAQKVL